MFPGDITALILASLSIIFSFFIDYGIYKSVVHYKHLDEKPKKLFFSVELLYVIFSSITLKTFAIPLIISIIDYQHQIITNWLFPISYGFQIHFLHLLWLNRLKTGFRDSLYQISSFIYYGYIICLLIPWICIILLLVLITDVDERLFYCYGSSYILSSIFLMPLFLMFIHKLHKLHHAMNKKGDNTNCSDTLALFIKTIILSFISIFCTIILVLSLIITKINLNIKMQIEIIYILLLIDTVKNAICTMLMYRYHENLYYKLFRSLHDKCTTLYSSKCNDNKQIPTTSLKTNIELGVKEEEKEKQKEFEISSMHQTIIKQLSVASILGPAQSITEKKSKSKSKSTSKPSKSNYKATKNGEGEDREEGGKEEAEEMASIDILRGTTSMSHISPIDESEESASMTTSNLIGNGSQLCD